MLSITKSANELICDENEAISMRNTFFEDVKKFFNGEAKSEVMSKISACDFFHTYPSVFQGFGKLVLAQLDVKEKGERVAITLRYGVENCNYAFGLASNEAKLECGQWKYNEQTEYLTQCDETDDCVGAEITYVLTNRM